MFITGISKDVFGYKLSITAVQQAGTTITVFLPSALKTMRKPSVAGQPGHAALPGSTHSSFGKSLIAML